MVNNQYKITSLVILILFLTDCVVSRISAETVLSEKATRSDNPYQFNTREPIYIIGNVHGAHDEMIDTLTKLDLLDEKGNWIGEHTQVVILGDFLGQDLSVKIIELLKGIQNQAKNGGGQIHVLLGDREFQTITNLHNSPKKIFSPEHIQWLINLPFVIQINDQVFAHSGLSKKLMQKSLVQLNQLLTTTLINHFNKNRTDPIQTQLVKSDTELLQQDEQIVFSKDNPVIYRGNVICHPYFEMDNLATILHHWSANRLWVSQSTVTVQNLYSRLDHKLMILSTSLNHPVDEASWVAKIDDSNAILINSDTGESQQIKHSPNRHMENPYNMTELEIEEFLKSADIIHRKNLSMGVTKPIKMTLQKDEKQLQAVFKYVDTKPGKERKSWGRDVYVDDRYFYDMAAYKMDRLLGIGLVPVVVERTIDGKKGILQLWINGLISKKTLKEKGKKYAGHCDYKDQINMLDTFDYLIRNTDRNQSNILYSQSDWQIWFIDHSRSFDLSKNRPDMMKKHTIKVTKQFYQAIKSLSGKKLSTLKPWLHRKQIRAIKDRRRKILKNKF